MTQATPRAWRVKLALAVGAIVAGLVAAEVVLRVAGVEYPRTGQRHDFRGTAYRPHVEWVQSGEGFAHIRTNLDGFRDDEWTLDKPSDLFRVAVLGDSYVDALQVEESDRFTERLEDELAHCASAVGHRIEVMNFGMSGYGTAQELLTYRHNVVPYAPDLVILAFLPHNDLRNNSRQLQRDPGRPYFTVENGALAFDDSFRRTPFHRQPWWKTVGNLARDYSRVLQVAGNARRALERRAEGLARSRVASETGSPAVAAELGLDDMSYLEPVDPAWQEAWQITEAIILALRDEVEAHGGSFLVVTLSAGDQVDPDPRERRRFQEALGVNDLFYADRRIAQLGKSEHFPVLNLAPSFVEYAETHGVHLHGFDRPGSGHWNEEGHRLAATLLGRTVCEEWEQPVG